MNTTQMLTSPFLSVPGEPQTWVRFSSSQGKKGHIKSILLSPVHMSHLLQGVSNEYMQIHDLYFKAKHNLSQRFEFTQSKDYICVLFYFESIRFERCDLGIRQNWVSSGFQTLAGWPCKAVQLLEASGGCWEDSRGNIFVLVFMDEESSTQGSCSFSGSLLAIYVADSFVSDFMDSWQRRPQKLQNLVQDPIASGKDLS